MKIRDEGREAWEFLSSSANPFRRIALLKARHNVTPIFRKSIQASGFRDGNEKSHLREATLGVAKVALGAERRAAIILKV